MSDGKLPLLRVRPDDVAPRVLVVGDPGRAEEAAGLLDGARRAGANREYVTFHGGFGGRRITVASHGVGAAGAGVCFEELARAGARILIRAGTCGTIVDGTIVDGSIGGGSIGDGEQIIACGAVRDEGLTPRLVPLAYPAAADHRVVAALEDAARAAGIAARTGFVLTTDLFYPSKALGQSWEVWQKSGVLAVEMEAAALFVIASLHGLRAGGIFTVDGNPSRAAQDMSDYDPYRSVVSEGKKAMLEIALTALAGLEE